MDWRGIFRDGSVFFIVLVWKFSVLERVVCGGLSVVSGRGGRVGYLEKGFFWYCV